MPASRESPRITSPGGPLMSGSSDEHHSADALLDLLSARLLRLLMVEALVSVLLGRLVLFALCLNTDVSSAQSMSSGFFF